MIMKAVVRFWLLAVVVIADHPCDDEHGQFCPAEGPTTLGACLKQHELSEGCATWVKMHDACEAECQGYCSRACDESTCCYSNDAIACLMNWENQDNLSDGCKSALPAREEKTQPERSEGAKRKSAARKAAREAAAAKVRRMQAGEDVESDTSDPGAPAAQLGYGADL